MEIAEEPLERIEAQRSVDVIHHEGKLRCFLKNLVSKVSCNLLPRAYLEQGTPVTPPVLVEEPAFLSELRVSDVFRLSDTTELITPEVFSSVFEGTEEWLQKLRSLELPLARLKNHQGDSVLHLAAQWNDPELAKSICSECPCLLLAPNSKGQLPIHVAANGGSYAVLKVLTATSAFISDKLSDEERWRQAIYVMKDIDGNTPLHLALKKRDTGSASHLVDFAGGASFIANKDGISPLYLAVKIGLPSLVRAMLERRNQEIELSSQLEGRKDLVHAAFKSTSIDTLGVILDACPSFLDELDEEGRTCLSYGASIGYHEGVRSLLERSTQGVLVCDDDGSFPLHRAVENNRFAIVREIIKRCPMAMRMHNRKGQNILHVAAARGGLHIVRYLVKQESAFFLENEQDVDGNTPLHVATIKWRHLSVLYLSNKVNLFIENNRSLTSLDLADFYLQPQYIFRQRMTRMCLVYKLMKHNKKLRKTLNLRKPSSVPLGNKEYIGALMVVAGIVASVSYASAVTFPGGYDTSHSSKFGTAVLEREFTFVVYMLLNAVSFITAIMTMISLVWALLGDSTVARISLDVALPLMFVSVICMANAFIAAMVSALRIFWVAAVFSSLLGIFISSLLRYSLPHLYLQKSGFGSYWTCHVMISSGFLHLVTYQEEESFMTSSHMTVKTPLLTMEPQKPILDVEKFDDGFVQKLVHDALVWSSLRGLVVNDKAYQKSGRAPGVGMMMHAPIALLPTPFSENYWNQACEVAPIFNELVDRISLDGKFIQDSLSRTEKADGFTSRLLGIHSKMLQSNKREDIRLGLHRSDYMLDEETKSLLQIEMNTISCSFQGFGRLVTELHRSLLRSHWYHLGIDSKRVPRNASTSQLADAMAKAWIECNNPRAVVMVVVRADERNMYDQLWLSGVLTDKYKIVTIRKTLAEVENEGSVQEDGTLIVGGQAVSVVYYRSGCAPSDYPSESEWNARLLIEQSSAVKCPSIAYHLAGTKKIQQELAKPGVLERFMDNKDDIAKLRKCFPGLWSLDDQEIIKKAIEKPELFVMKPQSEGGGNNIYGDDVRQNLLRLPREGEEENAAYILTQRIFPKVSNVILLGEGGYHKDQAISELGVYGAYLRNKERVIINEQSGYLMRTKVSSSDEGGVATGYALDSIYLY